MMAAPSHLFFDSVEKSIQSLIQTANGKFAAENKKIKLLTELKHLSDLVKAEENRSREVNKQVEKRTYAQAVSDNRDNRLLKPVKAKHVIVIKPKDQELSPEDTRSLIKARINPKDLQVGISEMKKVKGGLLIECSSVEDCIQLEREINEKHKEVLIPQIPRKRNPKLIIYNVEEPDPDEEENDPNKEESVPKEDITESIIKQNREIGDFLKDKDQSNLFDLKFKFKLRAKEKHRAHAVFEVSPDMRRLILSMGKVSVNWMKCQAKDYIPVIRCYKCNRFGHFSKDCQEEEEICGKCSEKHPTRNCNKTPDAYKCINCTRSNVHNAKYGNKEIEQNHSAFNLNCPSFKRIQKIIIEKTNYG